MKTILLIEDDTALRENTAELLELSDFRVLTAPNGRIGINKVNEHFPDLIVCDILMPEVDGYGVLESVSKNPKTSHIPFIFLSAKTEHREVRKGMNLGADDYISKPFEEEELMSAIQSRLAKAEIVSNVLPIKTNEKNGDSILRNLNELKSFFEANGGILNFSKGDLIYKEGARSNKIYLIQKGVVKSYKMNGNGKELITALYKADDFLGFTSFAKSIIYQESVMAVEDVQVAAISKNALKEIIGNNKEVSVEILNLLSDNISDIKKQLLQMAYGSVRKKTASTILQFAKILDKKPEDAIKISRYDLASVAGIAPESLIRTLSGFKKKGLIEIKGRNIRILDLEKLNAIE